MNRPESALEPLTVLVADDELPHRRGVREALEKRGFAVVAEVGNAESALAAASRLQPDFCLIELELPEDGLHAIGRIAKSSPQTQIVVLSRSDRPEDVVNAFTRGASGYLLKGIGGEQLARTLRAAHAGEPAVSRTLVPYLVAEIRRGSERRLTLPEGSVLLTRREWEVGDLLREGHSTAQIATRLGVSPVTVRRYVGLLLQKLGVDSRQAAIQRLRTYSRR
ncbi:MAG TPA: response regulator transcription factor [Gaiellaceae bacterium]|jgi:two-component system, NarL family, nitrate/nitrite response regulator NarL|nr:response regulator transcription factor [Gaiellaceae bacterium]